jgi:hypothetical protein
MVSTQIAPPPSDSFVGLKRAPGTVAGRPAGSVWLDQGWAGCTVGSSIYIYIYIERERERERD